jgi:hypothetical protein
MRDFLVSLISLAIILAAIWSTFLAITICTDFLIVAGAPVELVWFTVGAAVLFVKPGDALIGLSSKVWGFVSEVAYRLP